MQDYRADLPADFIAVIEKAIDPDPLQRFRTAGAMLHALDGLSPSAKVLRRLAAQNLMGQSRPSVMSRLLGTVIILVLALAGVWLLVWIGRQILRMVLGQ